MQTPQNSTPQRKKQVIHFKQCNFTAKKATAIIKTKKLPKDFFASKSQRENNFTTKRKIISYECSPISDQILSQRKIISQNMINLNPNFDSNNEAQITSFFGFKFEDQDHCQVQIKDNYSQNCNESFENVRIHEEYIRQTFQDQKDHQKITNYFNDNPSFSCLQIQPKCSIQLNSPQDQRKYNIPRQQVSRKTILDCTFAYKPVNMLKNFKEFQPLDNEKRIKGKSVHLVRPPKNENCITKIDKSDHKFSFNSKQNQFKYTAKKTAQFKKNKNNIFGKIINDKRKCESQHQTQEQHKRIRLPPINNRQRLLH